MVESLGALLNAGCEKSFIEKGFSDFTCQKDSEVELFLKTKAIDFETKNLSRTFFVLDDDSFHQSKVKINGYFSISMRPLVLSTKISTSQRKQISKSTSIEYVSGYLIGQIARNDSAPKGFGKELIKLAVERIKTAQEIIGGRFVYLDCKHELQAYYKKMDFQYLQKKEVDKNYVQMYSIL